jgi:hypothetical protein
MKDVIVYDLIKFGSYEHMKQFQKGKIFARPLGFFKETEQDILDNAKRHDQYEGAAEIIQPKVLIQNNEKITIQAKDGGQKFDITPDIYGNIKMYTGQALNTPVFCMYSVNSIVLDEYQQGKICTLIDKQVNEFGKYLVFIKDFETFINRIKAECRKQKNPEVKPIYNLVEYIDVNTHHGEYRVFNKPMDFKFQSEFRIAFYGVTIPNDNALNIDIGDISDISTLMSFEEFKRTYRICIKGMEYNPFVPFKLQKPKPIN